MRGPNRKLTWPLPSHGKSKKKRVKSGLLPCLIVEHSMTTGLANSTTNGSLEAQFSASAPCPRHREELTDNDSRQYVHERELTCCSTGCICSSPSSQRAAR